MRNFYLPHLCAITAAVLAINTYAASLNTQDESKVNGITGIDARGERLSPRADFIDLSDYINDNGLKKTFRLSLNQAPEVSSRTDDRTTPGTHVVSFFTEDNELVSFCTFTYDTAIHWDKSCETGDGAYKAEITDTKRNIIFDGKSSFSIPANFFYYHEDVVEIEACRDNSDCQEGEKRTVPSAETGNFFSKTTFSNDAVSYDDCIVTQFDGGVDIIRNAVFCKDVGIVRAWRPAGEGRLGYRMELQSVTGELTSPAQTPFPVPFVTAITQPPQPSQLMALEKTIVIDGDYSDWPIEARVYLDEDGPDCGDAPGQDIEEVYVAQDNEFIYFSFILNGPLDETFGYKFGENLHLFVGKTAEGEGYIFYASPPPLIPSENIPSSFVNVDNNRFEAKFNKCDVRGWWEGRELAAWSDQGSETICRDHVSLQNLSFDFSPCDD